MSAAYQIVQRLARELEASGTSKTKLRKVLVDHIIRLAPLRPIDNIDLESFYTVAAWYLTPSYLQKQDSVAGDLDVIKSSRRIKAIITLNEAWGMKAVEALRKDLREPLPLPNIPSRDFLETLAKIATKRYALSAVLKDLPAFIESRIGSWRIEDPRYFRNEIQPCLQFRHVDAFYKDWYTPHFLQYGSAIDKSTSAVKRPSKRRKTSLNAPRTHSFTRTASQDDDVELPRQTDLVQRIEEDSVVQEPSPAPSPSSSQQRAEHSRRHRTGSTASRDNDSTIQPSELQFSIDSSIVDQEPGQQTSVDNDDSVRIDSTDNASTASDDPAMPRPRGPFQDEIQAAQLVQNMFNELQDDTMNPMIQWSINMAQKREALRAAREVAYETMCTADRGVDKLKELISRKVPSGMSLEEARRSARDEIKKTAETIDQLIHVQRLFQDILPDVQAVGLQNVVNISSSVLNETSAEAIKMGKENKLKELDGLGAELEQREEDLEEKATAADQLDNDFAHFMTKMKRAAAFIDLLRDEASCAAIAKLPTPATDEDG